MGRGGGRAGLGSKTKKSTDIYKTLGSRQKGLDSSFKILIFQETVKKDQNSLEKKFASYRHQRPLWGST
jgi:hypothetical protein